MNPKILLLGKNGQLGWELQRSLASMGQLIAHSRQSCDITNLKELRAAVSASKPDVIVNASAYTAVDKAEQDAIAAFEVNANAVSMIAHLAETQGALLVHYSTDYVFDGRKASPYVETDLINPLSVYGRSKAEGERAVIESGVRYLLFRTSWVFGVKGSNFARTMLRLAAERKVVRVVVDQIGAPTSAECIADVTACAIKDIWKNRAPCGLYHVAAAGETNWHDYANFLFKQARLHGIPLKSYSAEPVLSREYVALASRPLNSRLDTSKLRETFGIHLSDWQDQVGRLIHEIAEHRNLDKA